jgi:hypothetical protein
MATLECFGLDIAPHLDARNEPSFRSPHTTKPNQTLECMTSRGSGGDDVVVKCSGRRIGGRRLYMFRHGNVVIGPPAAGMVGVRLALAAKTIVKTNTEGSDRSNCELKSTVSIIENKVGT